ncbi:MAG: cyclic peptide export ABC transporter [Gammaproteobacteria bacterium]|nr:cyclic peptide export ABC transporter [Gammaproteobacteria bacterium]
MSLVREIYRNNRWIVLPGTALVMGSALANIATINFINESIASHGQYFMDYGPWLILLLCTSFGFGVASQWMMTGLSYRIIYQLRGRLLTQVLQTELEHINQLGKGKIYAALTKDVLSLQEGFVLLPFFMYSMTLVLGGFGYMLWLSWHLALLCFLALALTIAVGRVLTFRFQHLLRQDRELEDNLLQQYGQILDGHKELLLNERRGDWVRRSVMDGPAQRSRVLRTLADRYMVVHLHMMTVITLGLIGLVFWAIYHWHWGDAALGAAFALVLLFIRQPINMAMNHLPHIISARISLQKLASLGLPEPNQQDFAEPLSTHWQALTLRGASYRYPGNDDFALGPLDLTIRRGELIFLVGHNGAGKSTLTRLLIGLLAPTSGRVNVDGITIDDTSRRQYRAMFSAVLTDFFLFDQVMAQESGPDSDAQARRLLGRLQLDDTVSVQNGKFSQTALSTGQRKRLAMVVACMEQRSVMVLDEWAADQDPYFRKIFYEAILPELKTQGMTTIVVSHDDRYFHVADRVLKLEHGILVELPRLAVGAVS